MSMAARTSEYSDIERYLLSMSTPVTCLTGIGRVDFDKLSASLFRFARQFAQKLRPRGIGNALGQTMVMNHAVHLKVFDTDHTVAVDDLAAFLMGEIISTELHPLVYPGDNLAVLASLRRALHQFSMLALD